MQSSLRLRSCPARRSCARSLWSRSVAVSDRSKTCKDPRQGRPCSAWVPSNRQAPAAFSSCARQHQQVCGCVIAGWRACTASAKSGGRLLPKADQVSALWVHCVTHLKYAESAAQVRAQHRTRAAHVERPQGRASQASPAQVCKVLRTARAQLLHLRPGAAAVQHLPPGRAHEPGC